MGEISSMSSLRSYTDEHPKELKRQQTGLGPDSEIGDEVKGSLKRTVTASSQIEFPESEYYQNKSELYLFVALASLAACVSSITIPIYFPTLQTLANYFGTTVEMINLTATMYSIFQGASPLVWATLSDAYGRRPAYLACISINLGANIGLAVCESYWVLFGLRILQAFGGASTVPLASAVIGDVTQRRNRGGLMGTMQGLSLLGNCFGPVIGGALIKRWGWRSVFWFLVILAAFALVVIFFLLPETNRQMAGTGAHTPDRLMNRSPYICVRRRIKGIPYPRGSLENDGQWMPPPHKTNMFRPLYLLRQSDVILLLIPLSVMYTTWYMVLTAQSTALERRYSLSVQSVGFTYISSGVGTLVSSVVSGRIMQLVYRREMDKFRASHEAAGTQMHMRDFDIFYARLSLSFIASAIMIATTFVFGWTIRYHVSYYVPIVMTFFVSFAATYMTAVTNTLLIDLFPNDAAAAVSVTNLSRCLLCAAGLAAVDKMVLGIGEGGAFSIMAGLCAVSVICLVVIMRHGRQFAEARRNRENAARQILA